jgi:hypothetical protein
MIAVSRAIRLVTAPVFAATFTPVIVFKARFTDNLKILRINAPVPVPIVNHLAVVFRKRFAAIFTDAKRVIKTGFAVCLPVQWQSPKVITCIVGFYEFAATVTLDKIRFKTGLAKGFAVLFKRPTVCNSFAATVTINRRFNNFLFRRRDNSRLFHSFVSFRVFVMVTGNAGPVP